MPRSTNTHLHREHTELDEPQEQASEIDSIVQQQRSRDRDQDQTTTTQTLDRARERGRETRSKGERQQESKREGRRELCRQCTQREGCSQSDDGLMSTLTGPSSRSLCCCSSIPSFAACVSLALLSFSLVVVHFVGSASSCRSTASRTESSCIR